MVLYSARPAKSTCTVEAISPNDGSVPPLGQGSIGLYIGFHDNNGCFPLGPEIFTGMMGWERFIEVESRLARETGSPVLLLLFYEQTNGVFLADKKMLRIEGIRSIVGDNNNVGLIVISNTYFCRRQRDDNRCRFI